jgi:hypothetical protein
LENPKDVYISLLFSIIPYEMMTTYKHTEFNVKGKQYEAIWMVKPSKPIWEEGSYDKNSIDKALFVDSSGLIVNLDTGEVDDDEGLMKVIDRGMSEINRVLAPFMAKYEMANLHFILGADVECQDLAYAAHYICDKRMIDKVGDSSFRSYVVCTYANFFDKVRNLGWSVAVDYCGLFEIKIVHAPIMPQG